MLLIAHALQINKASAFIGMGREWSSLHTPCGLSIKIQLWRLVAKEEPCACPVDYQSKSTCRNLVGKVCAMSCLHDQPYKLTLCVSLQGMCNEQHQQHTSMNSLWLMI